MPTTRINAAGVQYVRDHLSNIPRPDREARRAIQQWLAQHGNNLDPDQIDVVTLHYRADGPDGYLASITQCLSLTQALLGNWQGESENNVFDALLSHPWAGTFPDRPISIVETLPAPGFNHYGTAFDVFNGLFLRVEPQRYDASTLIQIPAEDFQRFIEALDFHAPFKATLDNYWHDHFDSYRLSSKLNFIAACNKQVAEGSLGDEARKLVWRAADLLPRGRIRLSTLSIYGYAATDLLYMNDADSDLTVLYIPGNSAPLLQFSTEIAMKDWIGQQCKDPARRQALKQHFRLADGPQGLDFSGLDTALEGLADYPNTHRLPPEHGYFNDDGVWPPRTYVNYRPGKYNPRITGDMFQALAERQRQRSYDDADFIITRDSDVTKARWRGYLITTLNLLAALTFVVPGLAPLLALGGIAQLGLGVDQAINGKTLHDQQDGITNITWGLFNAVPLAFHGLSRSTAIFEVKNDAFVAPSRINDQIGYPLSPVSPPRLPEIDAAQYFHIHEPIAPLPEADQAIASSVIRMPRYDGTPDNLDASIDTYSARMVYDMARDVFICEQDLNEVNPVGYIAREGNRDLQVVPAAREVTDTMRTRSLRALGVDLPLPVELPVIPAEDSTAIPRQISCLWVGDKLLSAPLLANLASNATRLTDSEYTLRLFLSNATPAAYAENLRLLTEQAPGLQVLPLEDQAFFQAFRESPYHSQYLAALDGNGGVARNFSSASDVLRYPMLHHEGGLYMDVDDMLLTADQGEAIDAVALLTPQDGLLLPPPMSNEKMSMNCLYNTSLIGSHAGNPTLEAISAVMHERFQANPEFYDSKPSLSEDPQGFYRYASQLSRMTGPALLTEVVDQRLPSLRTLRQVMNLCTLPRRNAWQFVNLDSYQEALRNLLPLNRFAEVGSNNSWVTT
ncbi:Dermonecrotic toxin [compost metagenome]